MLHMLSLLYIYFGEYYWDMITLPSVITILLLEYVNKQVLNK
jgi:hypothetical protein